MTIGQAEISPDGEIISIELDGRVFGTELKDMVRNKFVESITIKPNYSPAVEKKRQQWEANMLQYGR